MRDHMIGVGFSLFPEFLHQFLIYWAVEPVEVGFPALEEHLFPEIKTMFHDVGEIDPMLSQTLKLIWGQVAGNMAIPHGDVGIVDDDFRMIFSRKFHS